MCHAPCGSLPTGPTGPTWAWVTWDTPPREEDPPRGRGAEEVDDVEVEEDEVEEEVL